MNMHAPQSYEAATELEEIAAIPYNIVSPRHAKPLIGVFQDSVVGSYRLTRASVEFTRREFMNLMMRNKRFEGVMPPPKAANGTRWSGKQALSQLFPPINIQVGNKTFDKDTDSPDNNESFVKIKQGELIQGQIDGPTWMSSGKGIIHTIYNDYGPQETSMLLDSLQRVVEDYLVLDGFSVGISDLVADDTTAKSIQTVIGDCKKKIEEIQFQVHTDIFENNTGKTNQQEFEDQAFGFLKQATSTASNAVKKSLSSENRLVAMINSGSKGDWVNIAQMIACLGQQAIENKRIAYGFTDRTLPHYKKYDDGAEARGFIESSFIRGLTPQEFFFHAMSGREGLIDTAVKSVTGDTPIVIMEKGRPKYVRIGDWIDAQLDAPGSSVEHHEDRNLELLKLEAPVHIPTSDLKGTVTWGHVTAITRHDPGTQLYEIKTEGGKEVIVTESKSLLVWNEEEQQFQRLNTPEVKTGQYVPVTMRLAAPPILLKSIDVSNYLPKNTYMYGSEFLKAKIAVEEAMEFGDGLHIPQGWWGINNGTTFTLPYDSKARFTRALHRSNMECIQEGCVYPYAANRTGAKIPDQFELNHDNGLFLGLFLAEGNVDVKSGYVQITNNDSTIREFVKGWFTKQSIKFSEEIKSNHISGTSSGVRGFSTILALFLDALVGHGAGQKHIPDEAIAAPEAFLQGLLNGYFSGDGTVSHNSVEVGSASKRLIEGISMLCTRLSLFGKTFQTQLQSNNLGTEHIQPTYRFSLRGQWASQFAKRVALIDSAKQDRLTKLRASASHRNFTEQNDVVLDKIVEINVLGVEKYPKMYDLTVPSTLNFGLANGLHVVDTAETGYIQRQIIKALEDLVVQHDGTVRDANMNVVQFYYGEDGIMATKLENQILPLDAKDSKLSREDIKRQFGLKEVDWSVVLKEGGREDDNADGLLDAFVEDVLEDQKILIEQMFQGSIFGGSVNAPVNLARMILNVKTRFGLDPKAPTDLTPIEVLRRIPVLIERTQSSHVRLWCALLRCYLSPHKLIVKERFTKNAFDALCELIVVAHMKAWVQPGEQVGIIAAQSIGEPSTQLTLNSVDWDERIIIAKDGKVWTPKIGEFIDNYESAASPARIQHLDKGQIYIDLAEDGHEWKALSCDENGVMQWTKLEAITKHPVVNEDGTDTILEIELKSGKTVKATKGKSFLTVVDGKLVATNGSDLKVGDELPCALTLALNQIEQITALPVRDYLSPKEWLYGSEVQKALVVMKKENEKGNRHWFRAHQGTAFTVPYSRSDAFRDAFLNGKNPHEIREGHVYPKFVRREATQIPETIPLNAAFGFFCGAYLAEGMSNANQVNITNNDKAYLDKVKGLMDTWSVGTHQVEGAKHATITDIKGYTTSLIIHSTVIAKLMGTLFGKTSYTKDIPDWVVQAPNEFVKALVDGYISGDGCVHPNGTITYSSVSEALMIKLNLIMARYGIFTTMSNRMPPLGNFKSVSMSYTSYIGEHHGTTFATEFTLTIEKKQKRLEDHWNSGEHKCKRSCMGDVMLDKIKTIKEIRPLKGMVYDLTVEKTRNFVLLNTVAQRDTFHLAGVASKSNVNQGIPRLKEILKVSKNPTATSLLIYMKPEYRHSKEKARELVQDLELTLLRSITNKVAIYWEPTEDETVIPEDVELLNFYKEIELEKDSGITMSKWLLRLELNREEMFNKNISMADVVFVIQMMYDGVKTVYSDYNADKLVMRIHIPEGSEQDDFNHLKKFQSKLLNTCVIRGVPGIKAVTFREDKQKVELSGPEGRYTELVQYVLDTDGTNYVKVMNHPLVDANKLYTTNIYDIINILGLEAVRAILVQELIPIFGQDGVNYRHLGILCDYITRSGRLMSIDRYGINKNDVGPLGKMSFEETSKIVMNAALFGEVDPVTGVSANIMMGQPIRGGTAFSQILLDDQMLETLTKGLDAIPDDEEEEEGDLSGFMGEGAGSDPCHRSQFQVNMLMPSAIEGLEDEPPIDLFVKGSSEAITA